MFYVFFYCDQIQEQLLLNVFVLGVIRQLLKMQIQSIHKQTNEHQIMETIHIFIQSL